MNSNKKRFFISTAIPYVNAAPHIGFALELVQADTMARFRRQQGDEVFFLTGTDENALKNVLTAEELGIETREFVNKNAARFKELGSALTISSDDFIRTTDIRHITGAQKLWSACKPGDIYKKQYRGLYCIGCEEFKTEKDLHDGRCPEHPAGKLETVEEENYFFRLSAYQKMLAERISLDVLAIIPATRKNEMLAFISQGLRDFSISRSRRRAHGWGIPVPGDEDQIQYVWFDALTNYITALGYAENSKKFNEFWRQGDEIVHIIGKGITRFHAIYWPAILESASIRLPKTIFVHGYITTGGVKMSKTAGNVVDPFALVEKYGADAVRYYLLREIPASEDGDFSEEKFRERYNADLANGIGNFAARVTTLAAGVGEFPSGLAPDAAVTTRIEKAREAMKAQLAGYRFHEALASLSELVSFGDVQVNEKKPWAMESGAEKQQVLLDLVVLLDNIAALAAPFIPAAAAKITAALAWEGTALRVRKTEPLFPRLP